MFTYRLQVRIVLKAVLRYEPVLDFAGNGDACASWTAAIAPVNKSTISPRRWEAGRRC